MLVFSFVCLCLCLLDFLHVFICMFDRKCLRCREKSSLLRVSTVVLSVRTPTMTSAGLEVTCESLFMIFLTHLFICLFGDDVTVSWKHGDIKNRLFSAAWMDYLGTHCTANILIWQVSVFFYYLMSDLFTFPGVNIHVSGISSDRLLVSSSSGQNEHCL